MNTITSALRRKRPTAWPTPRTASGSSSPARAAAATTRSPTRRPGTGLGRPDRALLEPARDPSPQLDRVAGGLGVRGAALSGLGKRRRGGGLHAGAARPRGPVARLRLAFARLADREPRPRVGPATGFGP